MTLGASIRNSLRVNGNSIASCACGRSPTRPTPSAARTLLKPHTATTPGRSDSPRACAPNATIPSWPSRKRTWSASRGAGSTDPGDEAADLYQMWVDPAHRRLGVGEKLLHEVIDWSRARDVRFLVLGVTIANSAAVRLYLRAGFEPVGAARPLRPDSSVLSQEMRHAPPGLILTHCTCCRRRRRGTSPCRCLVPCP